MFYKFKPIGVIQNDIIEPRRLSADNIISRVVIPSEYARGLDGIESFSHIIIVFWLHRIKVNERLILKVHPRNDMANPFTGVFATRSPIRPNPIGITTVELIERVSNQLIVKGLDAINGTPVIDIKPYRNESHSISDIRSPEWFNKK